MYTDNLPTQSFILFPIKARSFHTYQRKENLSQKIIKLGQRPSTILKAESNSVNSKKDLNALAKVIG